LFREANDKWFGGNQSSEKQTQRFIPSIYKREVSETLVENPFASRRRASSVVEVHAPSSHARTSPIEHPLPAKREQPEEQPARKSPSGDLLTENPFAQRKASAISQSETSQLKPESQPTPEELLPLPTRSSEPFVQESSASAQRAASAVSPFSDRPWKMDEPTFTIRYQPSGHGDPLLHLLLDIAARSSDKSSRSDLVQSIGLDASAKACVNCHSFERSGGETHVNWQALYRDPSHRAFTEFSHWPHLVQPKLRDCQACHALNTSKQLTTDLAALPGLHDFLPLQKASCVSCHNSQNAGDRCTQCHSYHVGAQRASP
jgi:hypothetical protein